MAARKGDVSTVFELLGLTYSPGGADTWVEEFKLLEGEEWVRTRTRLLNGRGWVDNSVLNERVWAMNDDHHDYWTPMMAAASTGEVRHLMNRE